MARNAAPRGYRLARPRPAVAGQFTRLDVARTAIEALENAGIDGDDIALLGRPAEVARAPSDPEIADRRLGRYLAPRVALGLVLAPSPEGSSERASRL